MREVGNTQDLGDALVDVVKNESCLLYTSDAADDYLEV